MNESKSVRTHVKGTINGIDGNASRVKVRNGNPQFDGVLSTVFCRTVLIGVFGRGVLARVSLSRIVCSLFLVSFFFKRKGSRIVGVLAGKKKEHSQ